jgi:hypothetical protein
MSTESTEEFVMKIKLLSETCDFGISLDDELRDRLIVGLNDVDIQSKLLKEEHLNFEQAKELALSETVVPMSSSKTTISPKIGQQPEIVGTEDTETISPKPEKQYLKWLFRSRSSSPKVQDSTNLLAVQTHPKSRSRSISPSNNARFPSKTKISFKPTKKTRPNILTQIRHKIQGTTTSSKRVSNMLCSCIRCRRNLPLNQYNKLFYCINCGGRGHTTGACKVYTDLTAQKLHQQREKTLSSTSSHVRQREFSKLEAMALQSFQINLSVNNRIVGMKVDRQAAHTIISQGTYLKYFSDLQLKELVLNKYEEVLPGQKMLVYGIVRVKVANRCQEVELDLMIIDSEIMFMPILGRDWLEVIFPTRLLMLAN